MRDRLAYSIEEAAEAANTGKTALYEALGSGELPARKRGRRTLILAADLRAWLEKLPALELKRTPNLSGALSHGCEDTSNHEAQMKRPRDSQPRLEPSPHPLGTARSNPRGLESEK
jgi:excisionase family DNA binding protein